MKSLLMSRIVCFFVVCMFFFNIQTALFSQTFYFIGEDILFCDKLVIAVNSVKRSPILSGFSRQHNYDLIEIAITILNAGNTTYNIIPQENFEIELKNRYSALSNSNEHNTQSPFTSYPGTQSRAQICFKVSSNDNKAGTFIFNINGEEIRIFCEQHLSSLLQKSQEWVLSPQEAAALGVPLINAQRLLTAKEILSSALSVRPASIELLLLLSKVYELQNDYVNSSIFHQKINLDLILDEKHAYELAELAFSIQNFDIAHRIIAPHYYSLKPKERFLLVEITYYNDDLEVSEELAKNLLEELPLDSDLWFTLGNILNKKNDIDNAIKNWEKAVEYDPENCIALYNIGVGYYQLNLLEEAKHYWELVLEQTPDIRTKVATENALFALQ